MSGVEIELRGVTKTFDRSVEAVAPMDLDLRPGRVTALLGPTGCGKSTLLRMIGGVETPVRRRRRKGGMGFGLMPRLPAVTIGS